MLTYEEKNVDLLIEPEEESPITINYVPNKYKGELLTMLDEDNYFERLTKIGFNNHTQLKI